MFGFGKKQEEKEMADWLEKSQDFGTRPKSVKFKRTYHTKIAGEDGRKEIHLLDYVMPDGKAGRGFLNGERTWSFKEDVSGIPDHDLVLAYCGWSWLTPRLASGVAQTTFESDGEDEAAYLAQKKEEGFENLEVIARYQFGQSEVFELRGTHSGEPARSAGNTEMDTSIVESDPCFKLPTVYFLLGAQVAPTLH